MAQESPPPDDIDSEDLNVAADRLDAALDRIVLRLDTPITPSTLSGPLPEIADSLDRLIDRLRRTLGTSPASGISG